MIQILLINAGKSHNEYYLVLYLTVIKKICTINIYLVKKAY